MPIDYKKYSPNWKIEIVPAILKRAENKCEFEGCGFENKELVWSVRKLNDKYIWTRSLDEAGKIAVESGWRHPIEKLIEWKIIRQVKVVLTVAHLDHDETNHNASLDRLMAMCQYHHLRYDAKEKYRRVMEKSNSSVVHNPLK